MTDSMWSATSLGPGSGNIVGDRAGSRAEQLDCSGTMRNYIYTHLHAIQRLIPCVYNTFLSHILYCLII